MDNILSMAGLALRVGRLEVGDEAASDACREKRCRLLLTACGAALGRGSCATAAGTDLGYALALAEKLAARAPARYGEAVERLRLKAERAAQRRQAPRKRPGRKKK